MPVDTQLQYRLNKQLAGLVNRVIHMPESIDKLHDTLQEYLTTDQPTEEVMVVLDLLDAYLFGIHDLVEEHFPKLQMLREHLIEQVDVLIQTRARDIKQRNLATKATNVPPIPKPIHVTKVVSSHLARPCNG